MFTILDTVKWDVSGDRKITVVGGLEISAPLEYVLPKPVFCPICKLAMRDAADIFSWSSFSCCYWCDNNFVRQNKIAWSEGWRPEDCAVRKLLEEKGRLSPSYDFSSLEV